MQFSRVSFIRKSQLKIHFLLKFGVDQPCNTCSVPETTLRVHVTHLPVPGLVPSLPLGLPAQNGQQRTLRGHSSPGLMPPALAARWLPSPTDPQPPRSPRPTALSPARPPSARSWVPCAAEVSGPDSPEEAPHSRLHTRPQGDLGLLPPSPLCQQSAREAPGPSWLCTGPPSSLSRGPEPLSHVAPGTGGSWAVPIPLPTPPQAPTLLRPGPPNASTPWLQHSSQDIKLIKSSFPLKP